MRPELPLSRATDPITSYAAADRLMRSGRIVSQQMTVLGELKRYIFLNEEYPTSAELAAFAGISRYTAARRLPDLEKKGLVFKGEPRVCKINGTSAVTWKTAEQLAHKPGPRFSHLFNYGRIEGMDGTACP